MAADPQTTAAEIAASIRVAADALNAAVDRAHATGLSVRFGISLGLRVTHVTPPRIERPRNWKTGEPGEEL